jgi:hypothetical protein
MTMGKIPGAPAAVATKSAKAVDSALAGKDCVRSLDAEVHTNVTDAETTGAVFRNAADLAVGCLAGQWGVAYGLTGVIGEFVLKVVLWLVDGVKLVIDGVRIFDHFVGQPSLLRYPELVAPSGVVPCRYLRRVRHRDGDHCLLLLE